MYAAPPPPQSPPPPPPHCGPAPIPTAPNSRILPSASSSAAEEVAAPARLLCRMSIAALVEDPIVQRSHSRYSSDSSSSSSESEAAIPPSRQLSAPQLLRTPLSRMTQEKLHRMRLKRPPSAGPHVYGDDDEDSSEATHSPLSSPSPPKKQRKLNSAIKCKNLGEAQSIQGTLVVYQPTCLDHHNDAHQENRARLSALCGPDGILHKPRFNSLQWANLRELKPARLCDMLRVHSFQYIQHLESKCESLPPQSKATTVGKLYVDGQDTKKGDSRLEALYPNEWMLTKQAKKCYATENPSSSGHFDNDSPISRSSYLAARLAAGAVCHAIDKVMHHETKNAFVIVRPPGHHAGPNGCVESQGFHRRPEMCTCGFCLLNNVAIGAAYAMATYGGPFYQSTLTRTTVAHVQRVAIIDFDIHHGNGTEEILRNLVPHQQSYPLPSSWAPLSFPSYKPWRDENDVDNVFFASIHLHDGDNFYPGSGKGPQGDSAELQDHENILNLPLNFIGPKFLEDRERLTVKAKKNLTERASRTFRDRVTTQLVPALRKFKPDLMLLSAGFDGHADDFYYFLTEDDYEWMTEQLAAVADECCEGRLVSVLEGGYNVELSSHQKRRLKAKEMAKRKNRSGFSSASSSPSASPARSTRTEGDEDDEDEANSVSKDDQKEREEEQLLFGSLARSCAAHVTALQRAGI